MIEDGGVRSSLRGGSVSRDRRGHERRRKKGKEQREPYTSPGDVWRPREEDGGTMMKRSVPLSSGLHSSERPWLSRSAQTGRCRSCLGFEPVVRKGACCGYVLVVFVSCLFLHHAFFYFLHVVPNHWENGKTLTSLHVLFYIFSGVLALYSYIRAIFEDPGSVDEVFAPLIPTRTSLDEKDITSSSSTSLSSMSTISTTTITTASSSSSTSVSALSSSTRGSMNSRNKDDISSSDSCSTMESHSVIVSADTDDDSHSKVGSDPTKEKEGANEAATLPLLQSWMGRRDLPRTEGTCVENFRCEPLEFSPSGELRFCVHCSRWKPDRTHHCSSLGKCVPRMDHNCPWINNTVGYRNHKAFFLFLFWTTIHAGHAAWIVLYDFLLFLFPYDLQSTTSSLPPHTFSVSSPIWIQVNLIIAFFLAFFFCLALLIFGGYHFYLIARNTTTIESMEREFEKSFRRACDVRENIFDIGTYNNICQTLGSNFWTWFLPWKVDLPGDGIHFPFQICDQIRENSKTHPKEAEICIHYPPGYKASKSE